MQWSTWKVWIVPVTVGVTLVAVIAGLSTTAHAQPPYPTPTAPTVTGAISDSTPAPGTTTTVTCTVLDENGDPVEGATCTFTIVSQPGTDASITPTAVTDATGKATAVLSAGSAPGKIEVEVGALGDTAPVEATVGVPETPTPPGTPALAPPTGGGPGGDGANWGGWLIGISGVLAAAAVALLACRVYSGRPRAS